jgi:hypothetical protein
MFCPTRSRGRDRVGYHGEPEPHWVIGHFYMYLCHQHNTTVHYRLVRWAIYHGEALATSGLDAVYIARAAADVGQGPHLDIDKVLALTGSASKKHVLDCVLDGHEKWRAQARGGSRRSEEPSHRLTGTLSAAQRRSIKRRLSAGLGTTELSIASQLRAPGWVPVTSDWLRAAVAAIPRTAETAALHAHFSTLIKACDSG